MELACGQALEVERHGVPPMYGVRMLGAQEAKTHNATTSFVMLAAIK